MQLWTPPTNCYRSGEMGKAAMVKLLSCIYNIIKYWNQLCHCLLHLVAMSGWFLIFSVVIRSRLFQPSHPVRLCGFTVCCSVLSYFFHSNRLLLSLCLHYVFFQLSASFFPFKTRLCAVISLLCISNTCHEGSSTSNA